MQKKNLLSSSLNHLTCLNQLCGIEIQYLFVIKHYAQFTKDTYKASYKDTLKTHHFKDL